MRRADVIFRVEGGAAIGMGHVMRCLALADALDEVSLSCLFVLTSPDAAETVRGRGYPVALSPSGIGADAAWLSDAIEELGCRMVAVDSYDATTGYLEALRRLCPVLAFCEAPGITGGVDVAYNYNFMASRRSLEAVFGEETVVLAGPRYAPLGKGYWDADPIATKETAATLLVTTGATDGMNACGAILEAMSAKPWFAGLRVRVAVGPFFEHADALEERWGRSGNVELVRGADMRDLIAGSDVAVAAGGTTVYELMRLGVPSVIFSFVDNQAEACEALVEYNYICDIRDGGGALSAPAVELVADACGRLLLDFRARSDLSFKYVRAVDGQGARRVAAVMGEVAFTRGGRRDD